MGGRQRTAGGNNATLLSGTNGTALVKKKDAKELRRVGDIGAHRLGKGRLF